MNQEEFNEILTAYRLKSFHAEERIKRLEVNLAEEKEKNKHVDAVVSSSDILVDELKNKIKLLEAAGDEIVASASFSRMAKSMSVWQKLRNSHNNNE
jgi:uncharacterized coiled-coil protein SlyX